MLETNAELGNATVEYEAATIVHTTFVSDGFGMCVLAVFFPHSSSHRIICFPELNVKELRPPRMDDSGRIKYPVLFRVYVFQPSCLHRSLTFFASFSLSLLFPSNTSWFTETNQTTHFDELTFMTREHIPRRRIHTSCAVWPLRKHFSTLIPFPYLPASNRSLKHMFATYILLVMVPCLIVTARGYPFLRSHLLC